MCDFVNKISKLTTPEKWEEYIQNCTPNSLPYISICRDFNMKMATDIFVEITNGESIIVKGDIRLNDGGYKIVKINSIEGEYGKHSNMEDCLKALVTLWMNEGGFNIDKSKNFKCECIYGSNGYELLTYGELNFYVEIEKSKKTLCKKNSNDKITVKYNNNGDIREIKIVSDNNISEYISEYLWDLI